MTRPTPRGERHRRRIVRRELAVRSVEAIDQQFVEPQIGGDCEPITGVDVDRMGVRPFLPLRIDT